MTSTFGRSRRTWTSAASVFIALVPPFLSACTHSDTVLALTLTAAPNVAPVHHVRLTLSNAGASDVKVFPEATVTQAMTFPATLAVVIGGSRSGRVDVAVDGLDAAMAVIANGGIAVAISSGERTNASVELLAGPSQCGNGVIDPGEECDDGNRVSGDGCDFRCIIEKHSDGGMVSDAADTAGGTGGRAGSGGANEADGGGNDGGIDGGSPTPSPGDGLPECPQGTDESSHCPITYPDFWNCSSDCGVTAACKISHATPNHNGPSICVPNINQNGQGPCSLCPAGLP